jgi:tetratricopeptide (TPR) repeat protein
MRKCIVIIFNLNIIFCFAQNHQIDSLRVLVSKTQDDSNKVLLLIKLARDFYYIHPDSCYYYANKGLHIAQNIGYKNGEVDCIGLVGYIYVNLGDYPNALIFSLRSLQLAESTKNYKGVINALNDIATVYYYQKDYSKSLEYFLQSLLKAENTKNSQMLTRALGNIGDTYFKLNNLDSALYYSNLAYQKSLNAKDNYSVADELTNLGDIYAGLNKNPLALEYYRMAIPVAIETDDNINFCQSTLGMAKVFQKQKNNDSAFIYAYKSMTKAITGNSVWRQIEASSFMAEGYEIEKNSDSAFKYLKLTVSLKDSLYSEERLKNIENITIQENARQQEIAEQKKKDDSDARKNLQRAGIAVFIPIFFLFILLLSRTKVKSRTIEFLGIVGLLLFFEFITDLLYPYISNWTNESPVWETLIFVILAACLEPISFKLEHWIKRKLIHKTAPVLKTS